jgi:hypothetical protein
MNEHIPEPLEQPCLATVDEVMQIIADGGIDADGFSQEDWIRRLWTTDFFHDMGKKNLTLLLSMVSENYHQEKYQELITYMEQHIIELLSRGILK